MKNYLKALVAIMLAIACIIGCASCKPDDGSNPSGGDTPGGDSNVVKPPAGDLGELDEESYRIRFVYSYTAKVVNDNGRTENKKEVATVKSIYVNVDNNGLTPEKLAEISGLTYNGYSFASWHADWDKDAQIAKDEAVNFSTLGKIDKDLTFYGERGNLAGPEATWRIEYQYPEVEEEDVEATADSEESETPEEVAPIGAILYIEGSGRMFDFANGNEIDVKWFKDQKLVNTVVIDDGITCIGSNAFKNFTKLASVKHPVYDAEGNKTYVDGLPASIERIGDSALMGVALKKFTAPAGLKLIEKNGMANTSLKEVVLNEGLTTLADQAFYGSNKIASILIPSTLKSIGNSAFHNGQGNSSHNLSKVFYNGNEAGFKSIQISMENLALTDFATTYYYKSLTEAGTEEVLGTFWRYAEEESDPNDKSAWVHPVQYSYTLSYFNERDKSAFHTISIPASPQFKDGELVVNEEGVPILKSVITEEIYNQHKNVRFNGYNYASFTGGKALSVGTVLNGDQKYTCVRGDILSEDGGIKFTYANNIINVYKDETTEKRIADDVTAIMKSEMKKALTDEEKNPIIADVDAKIASGDYVIDETKEQTRDKFIDDALNVYVDSKFATEIAKEEVKADFDARVKARVDVAFKIWDFKDTSDTGMLWTGKLSGLPSVKGVVIGEGVEYIGEYTFAGLSSISEVTIPKTVKFVGASAFSGCSSLVSVYYADAITDECCSNLNALTGVKTKAYSYVDAATAATGNYWTWTVKDESRVAWILDGASLTIGGDSVISDFESADLAPWYPAKDSITSVSFASNISAIGKNLLNGYENVVSITMPHTVRVIPESAFSGTGIVNDTSKYNNGVLVISNHLIKVDASVRNTELFEAPFGIYTIADGAFAGCESIKRIYLPRTVARINPNAFPDSEFDYIFSDGDGEEYWAGLEEYADFGDAKVLFKSDKRPTAYVLDENNKPTNRIEYVDGKYYKKVGTEYVIWGCDHVWSDWIQTKAPTCAEVGTLTRFCIYDKKHTDTQDIAMLTEHSYGEYVSDENATCVNALTESAKCTVEGCTSVDTRKVLEPVVDENGQPVLDAEGKPTYKEIFGDHKFENYVENNDQDCVNGMTKTAVCENEGCEEKDTLPVEGKDALKHIGRNSEGVDIAWENVPYVLDPDSATCLKPYGTKSKTCARNEATDLFNCTHKETIDATAADHPDGYVPATCKFEKETVDAKYLAQAATKTSPAKYYKSCSTCGEASTELTFEHGSALSFYDFEAEGLKASAFCSKASSSNDLTFDPADGATYNNFAKITSLSENDVTNKVLAIGRGASVEGWAQPRIANMNNTTANDVVHVIDTDFKIDAFEAVAGQTDNWLTRISIHNGSKCVVTLLFYKVDDATVSITICEQQANAAKATGIQLAVGTWYNIRLEYDVAGSSVSLKVTEKDDSTKVKTFTYENFTTSVDSSNFSYIQLEMRNQNHTYIINTQYLFDNLYFGAVSYAELYGERPAATPAE